MSIYNWVDNEIVTAAKLNNYGSGLEAIKQDCEDAVDDCESAQTRCEAATVHQPIVQSGTWWTWNQNTSAYEDTGEPVTGQTTAVVTYQEGTSGTTAPTGEWSSTVPTVAQGNYLWTKTVFNELYTTYSVARQGVDGSGSVTSVNGQSGVVVLDTDDISDSGCTNKWATQQMITDSHNHSNKQFLDGLSQSTLDAKANTPTFVNFTLLSASWSNSQYDFTGTYPTASYDLEIWGLQATATTTQEDAYNDAKIRGSISSNVATACGTVPTVDIPIILKVVAK